MGRPVSVSELTTPSHLHQVRLQFLGLLSRLTSSLASIQKVSTFALKHGPRCGDDLWDCLVEEVGSVSLNARINLLYFLDTLLDKLMWPRAAFTDEQRKAQTAALTDTRVAQPAIGALELGMTALVRRLGIKPSASAGHSYGEYAALAAAGVLNDVDFLKLSALRGRVMAEASATGTPGGMAAVQAEREQGVHRHDPGLHRLGYEIAFDDRRCRAFDR